MSDGAQTQDSIKPARGFSAGAVLAGFCAALLFYAGVGGWLFWKAPATLESLQERIPAHTVVITGEYAAVEAQEEVPATPAEEERTEQAAHEEPADTEEHAGPAEPTIEAPGHTLSENAEHVTAAPVQTVEHETLAETASSGKTYPSGLLMHPADGLHVKSGEGSMPVIRQDGLTPFNAYKRPGPSIAGGPKISIILADFGLSQSASEAALRALPEDISLAISPYATSMDLWMNEARARGHEIWMMLPMETAYYPAVDPGPHTLMTGTAESENLKRLNWVMSRTPGYVGFITPKDTNFLASLNDARPMLNALYLRGLGFMDGSPQPGPMPRALAEGLKAPYGRIDMWLDTEAEATAIRANLAALEALARQTGRAVGVIHPLPVSYGEVEKWAEGLSSRGLMLVPASAQTTPSATAPQPEGAAPASATEAEAEAEAATAPAPHTDTHHEEDTHAKGGVHH